jgi:hypothetical protein
LQSRIDLYGILFWSQREELFHLLGKRLRDLFTDDPVITRWVVALMGAVFGDSEGDKAQEIGHILEGLRPDWMGEEEFGIRMRVLAGWLPGKQEAAALVSAYVAAAIADLNERLERARANTRHELELDLQSAWVDDTAAGARRTNYKLGHDRSFHATCRRLEALQKARRAGEETMADDLDDETETETETETEPAGAGRCRRRDRPGRRAAGRSPCNERAHFDAGGRGDCHINERTHFWRRACPSDEVELQIRNPKSEIRNKSKIRNSKSETSHGVRCRDSRVIR